MSVCVVCVVCVVVRLCVCACVGVSVRLCGLCGMWSVCVCVVHLCGLCGLCGLCVRFCVYVCVCLVLLALFTNYLCLDIPLQACVIHLSDTIRFYLVPAVEELVSTGLLPKGKRTHCVCVRVCVRACLCACVFGVCDVPAPC